MFFYFHLYNQRCLYYKKKKMGKNLPENILISRCFSPFQQRTTSLVNCIFRILQKGSTTNDDIKHNIFNYSNVIIWAVITWIFFSDFCPHFGSIDHNISVIVLMPYCFHQLSILFGNHCGFQTKHFRSNISIKNAASSLAIGIILTRNVGPPYKHFIMISNPVFESLKFPAKQNKWYKFCQLIKIMHFLWFSENL